jgi:NAD-dependent DNA ligase
MSATALTQEQMFWLADTISSKRCTTAALAKQLGLKPRLLYKLASRTKYKKVMKATSGRAKALDNTALASVKWVITGAAASITREQIKAIIAEEYKAKIR